MRHKLNERPSLEIEYQGAQQFQRQYYLFSGMGQRKNRWVLGCLPNKCRDYQEEAFGEVASQSELAQLAATLFAHVCLTMMKQSTAYCRTRLHRLWLDFRYLIESVL